MHGPSRKMMLRLPPAYMKELSEKARRAVALARVTMRKLQTVSQPWWNRRKPA